MRTTIVAVVSLIVVVAGLVAAAPLGTEITYQGVLTEAGTPLDGTVDLRFSLFAEATGGSPLETTTVDDLTVTDGRVTAVVDFGDEWEGNERWLGIEVRDGSSTGAYVLLPERQELLATPVGLYAVDAASAVAADHASTTTSAATLDGQNGEFYRAFGNLTSVPGGLDDGDDDTAAGLACSAGETPSWDGSSWGCAPDLGVTYARTAVIGPVGDGSDPAANGAALLAAVSALPVPASQAEGWRVDVEPGRYDLGPSPLIVPPWSTLVGSGVGFTVVTGTICDTPSGIKATVILQNASELHDLTVQNSCSSSINVGRAVSTVSGSSDVRIGHVTVTETGGGTCIGVLSLAGNAMLDRVIATVSDCGGDSVAIGSVGANTLLTDCEGIASGFGESWGLMIGARAWVDRGQFNGTSSSGLGASGLFIVTDADIRNVITGGAWVGAYQSGQIVTFSRVLVSGREIEASDQGGSLLLVIEHSKIIGSGDTVVADTDVAIGIAMTQIYGSVSPSGGVVACAGVWDGTWTPYANTCP